MGYRSSVLILSLVITVGFNGIILLILEAMVKSLYSKNNSKWSSVSIGGCYVFKIKDIETPTYSYFQLKIHLPYYVCKYDVESYSEGIRGFNPPKIYFKN